MSVKNQLMEKFGLTKEEATNLISTNARNHGGKVDLREIEEDIEKIANIIIFNVGNIYKDYDVKHEILECGKIRQTDGLLELVGDEESSLVYKYLRNQYWQNVDTWVRTFYDATQHKVLEFLKNCDSIEDYRSYVDKLPLKNIYAVADFLNVESEIVELIAKYGNEKDFKTYMTDTRYVRDDYDNDTQRIERKSCSSALIKKILSKAREELAENGEIRFNRRSMMAGLSAIHRNKDLNDDQKEELQELYITKSLKGDMDELFIDFVNSRVKIESPYEAIKEYLEEVDQETSWDKKEEIINKHIKPVQQVQIQKEYNNFLENLTKQLELGEITPEQFIEILDKSRLAQRHMSLEKDEETENFKLRVYIKNPVLIEEDIVVEIEADRLQEIVDRVNKGSLDRANAELESITQKGIGEIKVSSDYKTEERFKYSSDNVLGVLNEEEYPPYVIGGEITENKGLTPLQVKYPYRVITNDYDIRLRKYEEVSMTEEQIRRFNETKVQPEISKHQYTYGKIDGYYTRTVYDFEVDGEQYHIKDADWTNGGMYTVVWKGEEENYPKEAIGLLSSYSEWARFQKGVDEDAAIRLILANPTRFSKMIDERARKNDCCGLYPTINLDDLCAKLMKMEPESVLKADKEVKHSKSDEAYVEAIMEKAKESQALKETESKAKDLLTEYEEIEPKNKLSLDDNE